MDSHRIALLPSFPFVPLVSSVPPFFAVPVIETKLYVPSACSVSLFCFIQADRIPYTVSQRFVCFNLRTALRITLFEWSRTYHA